MRLKELLICIDLFNKYVTTNAFFLSVLYIDYTTFIWLYDVDICVDMNNNST